MKDCTGFYYHKGFLIRFSEYYQEWNLEADFLIKEYGSDDVIINFISNLELPNFRTISKAKKYINENEKELKESIINEYLKETVTTNKDYYIAAYNELGKMIGKVTQDNYPRFSELCKICTEGQQLGIKELQKPE